MKLRIVLMVVGAAVLLTGCQTVTPADTTNTNTNNGDVMTDKPTATTTPVDDGSIAMVKDYITYTNRAIGYSIDVPENWHWRHFIKSDIDLALNVDDYLVLDPGPIVDVKDAQHAQILVEISKRALTDFADSVKDLTPLPATIAGTLANRYEGLTVDNKVITSIVSVNGSTYRILYAKAVSTAADEAVLQHVLDSIKLVTK